jgi:hypothetical protein
MQHPILTAWPNFSIMMECTPESEATLPPFGPIEGQKWFDQISSQLRVPVEPVCIDLFRQNLVFTSLHLKSPVHVVQPQKLAIATLCVLCGNECLCVLVEPLPYSLRVLYTMSLF